MIRPALLMLTVASTLGQFHQDLSYALDELDKIDRLERLIQYAADQRYEQVVNSRWVIDEIASGVLMHLAGLQVRLISQRNGPMGRLIDQTLSRIEEKSYQLKTMLIQLFQDKNTPVSYFPEEPTRKYGVLPSPGVDVQYRPYTNG